MRAMDPSPPAPPGLADLTARLAQPVWWSRGEAPFRYLLDNRLFRLLCEQPHALDGFRASLARHRLAPDGGLPNLELTPLAVLDFLGVEPPQFPTLPLPKSLTSLKTVEVTIVLVRVVRDAFAKEAELQPEKLRERVEELRQKTDPAAHELFDLCLTRFVSREQFEDDLLIHLAFDTLFRYRFPEEVREEVLQLFNASLLETSVKVSGLSKVRLLKPFWDRSYERLLRKRPQARAEIQAADQEMRLRTYKDVLGWEVIHHAILGYPAGRIHPVIAFTVDSEATLRDRCRGYKTALRAFLDQIKSEERATILRPRLDAWKPGWLVPCRPDGTFDAAVSTGEEPIF